MKPRPRLKMPQTSAFSAQGRAGLVLPVVQRRALPGPVLFFWCRSNDDLNDIWLGWETHDRHRHKRATPSQYASCCCSCCSCLRLWACTSLRPHLVHSNVHCTAVQRTCRRSQLSRLLVSPLISSQAARLSSEISVNLLNRSSPARAP